ncbi:MAG: nucleotidyltransferase domain-containing protein, partial [Gemmatimonadota bacterium]
MAARTDPRLKAFIDEHLPVIVERFSPTRVLAFGSRVHGEPHRYSDLDLVVVAESFRDMRWLDRPVAVLEAIGAP